MSSPDEIKQRLWVAAIQILDMDFPTKLPPVLGDRYYPAVETTISNMEQLVEITKQLRETLDSSMRTARAWRELMDAPDTKKH